MCFESFLVYINNEAGRHWSMEKEIREFVIYLHDVKKTSENTELSYKRDLQKLQSFLKEQGIEEPGRITETSLNSYILFLEKNQFAPATVSRHIAAVKAFFHFMVKKGMVSEDVSENLKAPRIEKKMPEILTMGEVAVSYTHLDVYKRQAQGRHCRFYRCGACAGSCLCEEYWCGY